MRLYNGRVPDLDQYPDNNCTFSTFSVGLDDGIFYRPEAVAKWYRTVLANTNLIQVRTHAAIAM
jgi:hypothetical protein